MFHIFCINGVIKTQKFKLPRGIFSYYELHSDFYDVYMLLEIVYNKWDQKNRIPETKLHQIQHE